MFISYDIRCDINSNTDATSSSLLPCNPNGESREPNLFAQLNSGAPWKLLVYTIFYRSNVAVELMFSRDSAYDKNRLIQVQTVHRDACP